MGDLHVVGLMIQLMVSIISGNVGGVTITKSKVAKSTPIGPTGQHTSSLTIVMMFLFNSDAKATSCWQGIDSVYACVTQATKTYNYFNIFVQR